MRESNSQLERRRKAHMGGSMLFYEKPLHLVRGEGVWLFDEMDRRYLDCYNNVACVGHGHPRVVDALCRQARLLNTHTRYLHEEIVNYAERLAATFPGKLNICLFVCTGSEANDLAMRIARSVSGRRGAIVMENAYHGNTTLINELSTCLTAPDERPAHVAAVEPPDTSRGPFPEGPKAGEQYAGLVDDAITQLEAKGAGVAAFLCDSIFDSQGTLEAPDDYFRQVYKRVRAAGGLCIADEVQAGFARTGDYMWGFEHHGVVPDVVTLGKPMGAGHPMAAVVTSKEILDEFSKRNIYFNTFGGNPVSAAVGNAVLDVFAEDGIQASVIRTSAYLRRQLEQLRLNHSVIGNVRGRGLFFGIEIVGPANCQPDRDTASRIVEGMRDAGVLVGATGRFGNIIKIRPPLIFSTENAGLLLDALESQLRAVESI